MEFINFILLLVLFWYIRSVSERVRSVERGRAVADFPKMSVTKTPPAPGDVSYAQNLAASQSAQGVVGGVKRAEWDIDISSVTSTQWLTGVGVLALLFGVGFFLRFAIAQGWLSEVARVGMGVVIGVLLIILGELWKNKYGPFAKAIAGGGLAILYCSFAAAFNWYHLIGVYQALVILVLVSFLTGYLGLRYNSRLLTAFGVVGGLLAPVILHTGENKQIELFVYLLVVNIVVLGVMAKRFWLEVLLVSILGTAIDFAVWDSRFGAERSGAINSLAFLITSFSLIIIGSAAAFRNAVIKNKLSIHADSHLGFVNVVYGFFVYVGIASVVRDVDLVYLPLLYALCGVVAFLAYTLVDRLGYEKLNYAISFLGSAFLVTAVSQHFVGVWLTVSLIVLAIIGSCVGVVLSRRDVRVWALVILLGTAFYSLGQNMHGNSISFIFNKYVLTNIVTVVGLVSVGTLYALKSAVLEEKKLADSLYLIAMGIVWLVGSVEIASRLGTVDAANARNLSLSVWWMVSALALGFIGQLRKEIVHRRASIVLFVLTIAKVFLYDVQALDLGYRIVSFITLGVLLLSMSFYFQKNKDRLMALWGGKEGDHV